MPEFQPPRLSCKIFLYIFPIHFQSPIPFSHLYMIRTFNLLLDLVLPLAVIDVGVPFRDCLIKELVDLIGLIERLLVDDVVELL